MSMAALSNTCSIERNTFHLFYCMHYTDNMFKICMQIMQIICQDDAYQTEVRTIAKLWGISTTALRQHI